MLDDVLKKFNEQIKDKDNQIIIIITRGYIQEFVEANYGRKLTKAELEDLSWSVWEDGDYDLMCWIDQAIIQIIRKSESKDNHKAKGGIKHA